MTLFLTVIEIVTPVFILALIGFAWIRMGYEYPVDFVTQLGMKLAVPCLVFTALEQTQLSPVAVREMTLAAIAAYGVLTVAVFALVWALGLSRRTYLAPLLFGNTGNLGLPLALFAFGDVGLGYAVVFFMVGVIWQFTFGLWVVAGGANPLRVLKEPMVIAAVLGAIFLVMDWDAPKVIGNAVGLIGQMAIPMMLITLGVAVARLTPGRIGQAIGLSAAKVVLCASTGFAVAWALGLGPIAAGILVLQLSTPVAVTSYLLAQRYDANGEAVAGLVVVSTLMAIIALPALLAMVL